MMWGRTGVWTLELYNQQHVFVLHIYVLHICGRISLW